jgi:hypothetical protein
LTASSRSQPLRGTSAAIKCVQRREFIMVAVRPPARGEEIRGLFLAEMEDVNSRSQQRRDELYRQDAP